MLALSRKIIFIQLEYRNISIKLSTKNMIHTTGLSLIILHIKHKYKTNYTLFKRTENEFLKTTLRHVNEIIIQKT